MLKLLLKYTNDPNALSEPLTCGNMEDAGAQPVPMAIQEPSGLYAQLYYANGGYVLAFRGTASGADVITDLQQGLTGDAQQYEDAVDYAEEVDS